MKFQTTYDIGDRVTIDRDEHLIGVVTAVMADGVALHITYRINWFSNGSSQSAWIEEWRINRWDG